MADNVLYNNKDITQHLLYSYTNSNKTGPTELMRGTFANDLIFDKSRKSVFTQQQEFGYICDYNNVINVGTATDPSYVNYNSYEGELRIEEFKPLKITNIEYIDTFTGKPIESHLFQKGNNTPISSQKITVSNTYCTFTAYQNIEDEGNRQNFYFNEYYIENDPTFSVNSITFYPNAYGQAYVTTYVTNGTYSITYQDTVTEYTSNFVHFVTDTFTWANPVWLVELDMGANATFESTYNYVKNLSNANVLINSLHNKHGELIINWDDDFKETFRSTADRNTRTVLCVPQSMKNDEIIYISVGNSTEELYKIVTLAYTNSYNYSEPYNLYLAYGNNWNGLKIHLYR